MSKLDSKGMASILNDMVFELICAQRPGWGTSEEPKFRDASSFPLWK